MPRRCHELLHGVDPKGSAGILPASAGILPALWGKRSTAFGAHSGLRQDAGSGRLEACAPLQLEHSNFMTRSSRATIPSAFLCLLALAAPAVPSDEPRREGGHRGPSGTNSFNLTVPAQPYDLILARPESGTVTLSVLAYRDMEGQVFWGPKSGTYNAQTSPRHLKAGAPVEVNLGPLQPDKEYYYRFRVRLLSGGSPLESPEYAFHTARPPGQPFIFTMTADAHLDEHTSPEVYRQTLTSILAERPDFHLDLGNLFMTDKHATREEAAQQYLAERFYLGQIGCAVPILLALGTHDGEAGRYDDGSSDCLASWSNLIRKRYFPNPIPDRFFSGNRVPSSVSGLLENYYAWEWGDALFVVLDPFRYTTRDHGGGDGWGWSLGKTQYEWLKETLEHSRAKFKFVFIHNLLCGDQAARGGVEVAAFNEWGGRNRDGSEGFKEHRPGWEMPIHPMLARNRVTAVFKAHDNFYARQELDGILYLMVPQPSFAGNDRIRDLENYGYKQGVFRGNSGHVRVAVSPAGVKIDYVRSSASREAGGSKNEQIGDRFEIPP